MSMPPAAPETRPDRAKRVRRTPEEARRLILDAAEVRMSKVGPGGLRLQDLARDLGMAHSTILHHFGSREGLVQAVNGRIVDALAQAIVPVLQGEAQAPPGVVATVFAAFRDGLAQRIVWLLQSAPQERASERQTAFDQIADALHAARQAAAPDGVRIRRADSIAIARLVTVAAFGDAFLGGRMRRGEGPTADQAAFEAWFAALLRDYLGSGPRRD